MIIYWQRNLGNTWYTLSSQLGSFALSSAPFVPSTPISTFTILEWHKPMLMMKPPASALLFQGFPGVFWTQKESLLPGSGIVGRSLFTGLFRGNFSRVN
jgi:hypothetical protein